MLLGAALVSEEATEDIVSEFPTWQVVFMLLVRGKTQLIPSRLRMPADTVAHIPHQDSLLSSEQGRTSPKFAPRPLCHSLRLQGIFG